MADFKSKLICDNYLIKSGLLAPLDDPNYPSWVPQSLRKKTVDYALHWYQSVPLQGIIISKSPSPYGRTVGDIAPKYAAAFAYDESLVSALPPASSDILAHEISLSCQVEEADVLVALRDCWKLRKYGVISVNALSLGREFKDSWYSRTLTQSDFEQIKVLAQALGELILLSAEAGAAGMTTIVAFGAEAQLCAKKIKQVFRQGPQKNWSLKIHELYHPARTVWTQRKRKMPSVTMNKRGTDGKEEFAALCGLLRRGPFYFRNIDASRPRIVENINNGQIDEELSFILSNTTLTESPGTHSLLL